MRLHCSALSAVCGVGSTVSPCRRWVSLAQALPVSPTTQHRGKGWRGAAHGAASVLCLEISQHGGFISRAASVIAAGCSQCLF